MCTGRIEENEWKLSQELEDPVGRGQQHIPRCKRDRRSLILYWKEKIYIYAPRTVRYSTHQSQLQCKFTVMHPSPATRELY